MPGNDANPIFFNKKMEIGRPEHSLLKNFANFAGKYM